MGISSKVIALINVMTYLPVALAILLSPVIVPRWISYAKYIGGVIVTLMLSLLAMPLSRSLI